MELWFEVAVLLTPFDSEASF
uniref:Uncharacterized protein n=1 Tax=Anguilla anguilla TaxID=7936 RepID=A0A0E9UWP0_ANGAN